MVSPLVEIYAFSMKWPRHLNYLLNSLYYSLDKKKLSTIKRVNMTLMGGQKKTNIPEKAC